MTIPRSSKGPLILCVVILGAAAVPSASNSFVDTIYKVKGYNRDPFLEVMQPKFKALCVTGEVRRTCLCWCLTSHEEEEAGHILHQASVPAATQHTDDPTKEDDGHRHAHEACRHSP